MKAAPTATGPASSSRTRASIISAPKISQPTPLAIRMLMMTPHVMSPRRVARGCGGWYSSATGGGGNDDAWDAGMSSE